MGRLKRVAPILPVSDLTVALAHYQRLGFATRAYAKGGYGFATLDGVEIHLAVVPEGTVTTPTSAYLFVEDAGRLAEAWISTGADVRVPVDTEWGQHEGVVIDPDGGSPPQLGAIRGFGCVQPWRAGSDAPKTAKCTQFPRIRRGGWTANTGAGG